MREFVVVAVLDECNIGDTFTMWPLHMTILPWFEAESVEEAVELLQPIAREFAPIRVELVDFAKFGANRTVRLVKLSPELHDLHKKLLREVQVNGLQIRGRYTGDHFSPHVTRTGGRDFAGDDFIIDKLYIAEALPMGKRRLIAELPFSH